MEPLSRLWQALEDMSGTRAVLADWKLRLGTDMQLAQALLRPTDESASSFPDNCDPLAPGYKVVEHAPNDIVGVPLVDGPTITLQKRDVLIFRLDERALCGRIAQALGFELNDEAMDGLPRTWRLGKFCPFAGCDFPVFLTIPHEPSDLLRVAESISSRIEKPYLLLAPTARRMRSACEDVLHSCKACFLALTESITAETSNHWTATTSVLQRIAEFQRIFVPQSQDEDGSSFFPTPSDASWSDLRIRFIDGESVSIRVCGVSRIRLFSELGMASRKNKKPTKQWDLLRDLAREHGVLSWGSPGASRKAQKQREELSSKLKVYFRIDGDPIEYDSQIKGWRTRFSLEPES
jgi:hypothetical protein